MVEYRTIQRLDGKYFASFSDKWYDKPTTVYDLSRSGCEALAKHLAICKAAGYVVTVVTVEINESEFM